MKSQRQKRKDEAESLCEEFFDTVIAQSPGFFVVKGGRSADYNSVILKIEKFLRK
jgi:hypothetical protein